MGIYIHRKAQKINTKNHGYKANSFARKGIDTIREMFRTEQVLPEGMINRIRALFRWTVSQAAQ